MPLATRKIADTIAWARLLSFNRNPVIGNALEPALTFANHIQQIIMSPPFNWWWNVQELVFTCNPLPATATSTAATVASNVLSVTAANIFSVGDTVTISGFTGALAGLNGIVMVITASTPTTFTGTVNFPNNTDTVGTFTDVATQDYTIPVANFSHIDHASVRDLVGTSPNFTTGKFFELQIKNTLTHESVQARPVYLSPHSEDGNGNMTFRVSPAPDKPYPVLMHVQNIPTPITSMNQVWSMPDFMQYIYEAGFLALLWEFADDPRAAQQVSRFKAALLGKAEGLTEEEKNIFLNNWQTLQDTYAGKMQQGMQARAV